MVTPFYTEQGFQLFNGDCNLILPELPDEVDMVFADPPYFLSNDGLTIQSGKVVSVNKGEWDKLVDVTTNEFNHCWIKNVRERMTKSATIWISGTMHNIWMLYITPFVPLSSAAPARNLLSFIF